MTNQNDENSQQHSVEANQTAKALVWARKAAQALALAENYAETSAFSGTTVAANTPYVGIAEITAELSGNVEISAHASFASGGTTNPLLQISINGGSFAPQYEWTANQGSPALTLILATAAVPGQTIRARFVSGPEDSTVTLGNGVSGSVLSAALILREIPASTA